MIIRVYRARARPGQEAAFSRALRDVSIPLLRAQRGLRALHVGEPREPGGREFVIVSVWQDLESLRAFTGDDWEQPVILQDDREMLDEIEVRHYESVE